MYGKTFTKLCITISFQKNFKKNRKSETGKIIEMSGKSL